MYASDSFQAMDKAENEYDVPVDTFELQQSGLKTQNPVDSKQPQNKYCKMSLLYLVLLVLILLVQVVSLSLILLKKGASDQVIYLREDYINDLLSSSTEQIMQNFNNTSGYFAEHIMNSNYRLSNEQLMAQQNSTDLLRDAIYSFSKTKELTSIFTILADLEENIQQLMVPKNSNNSLMIIEQLVTLQNSTDLLRDAVYSSSNKTKELASIFTIVADLEENIQQLMVPKNSNNSLMIIEQLVTLQNSTDLLRDAVYSSSNKTKELASIFTIVADLEENIQQLMVPKNSNNSLMIIEQLVTLQNSTDLLRDAVYSSSNKTKELASIFTIVADLEENIQQLVVPRNSNNSLMIIEQLVTLQNSTDLLRDAVYSSSNKTKELASIFTILVDLEENIQQLMVPKNSNNSLMIIEQLVTLQNSTDLLRDAVYSYNKAQELASIITSLTNLKDSVDSSAVVIDDILILIEDLIELRDSTRSEPLSSCEQLRNRYPIIPSGYYHIGNVTIYCHMGKLCNSTGGWTRLAYLNMSLPTENCPSGFQMYNTGGVRACGRVNVNTDCLPVIFPSNNISYSEICGRVVGYQHASTDAIDPRFGDHNDIDGHYVDGISITRGSPRQHVWTFMSGLQDEGTNNRNLNCPCSVGATVPVQSFIGEHYFCESGNPSYYAWSYNTLYIQDPLWDGQNCGT